MTKNIHRHTNGLSLFQWIETKQSNDINDELMAARQRWHGYEKKGGAFHSFVYLYNDDMFTRRCLHTHTHKQFKSLELKKYSEILSFVYDASVCLCSGHTHTHIHTHKHTFVSFFSRSLLVSYFSSTVRCLYAFLFVHVSLHRWQTHATITLL